MCSIHDMPVTSLTSLPAHESLLSVAERNAKDDMNEWIVSSSVDYTLSVFRCKRNTVSVRMELVIWLLFVVIAVAYGVFCLRK